MVGLTFTRSKRIIRRSHFQECFSRGRRYFTSSFIVFVRANDLSSWRLGMVVSRKVGSAVTRNRVKRLVRECFRLNQHNIHVNADFVVVCKHRADISGLNQGLVNQEIMELMQRIGNPRPGSKPGGA